MQGPDRATMLRPDMSVVLQASPARPQIRDFAGEILVRGDPAYDRAREVVNAAIDNRPALIVRCAGVHDVAAAVRHAHEHGLPVSVRGGGHAAAGFAITDGGLVVDVRGMNKVRVDPVRRVAHVGGGATWREFDEHAQGHGLAITGARVPSVGVAGFTLASGSGWLERFAGLATDNLRAARVVTADGDVLRTEPGEAGDLLWALAGGGGNFGVVAELEFALRPIGPLVLAGLVLHPWEDAAEVLAGYRDVMAGAPDEVCGGVALMTAPPAPFVPEALRGRPSVAVFVLHAGPIAGAEAAVARLRAIGRPVADLVRPMPYTAFQALTEPPVPLRLRGHFGSGFLAALPDPAIEAVLSHHETAPSPGANVLLTPLGGAFARLGAGSALGRRDAGWMWQAIAGWPSPAGDDAHRGWADGAAAALAPWSAGDAYPNLIADPDPERLRATYGAPAYERLVAAKRAWDPGNVFRANHNVAP